MVRFERSIPILKLQSAKLARFQTVNETPGILTKDSEFSNLGSKISNTYDALGAVHHTSTRKSSRIGYCCVYHDQNEDLKVHVSIATINTKLLHQYFLFVGKQKVVLLYGLLAFIQTN